MEMAVFEETMKRVHKEQTGEELVIPPSPDYPETPDGHFWFWMDREQPLLESGSSLINLMHHFEVALAVRVRQNVVLLHYAKLKADLEGEMRRLASRLNINIPEELWPKLVNAARFDSMKARASELAPNANQEVWKDASHFFHSGQGGHWREWWSDEAQARYDARLAELGSPEAIHWAHTGEVD